MLAESGRCKELGRVDQGQFWMVDDGLVNKLGLQGWLDWPQ